MRYHSDVTGRPETLENDGRIYTLACHLRPDDILPGRVGPVVIESVTLERPDVIIGWRALGTDATGETIRNAATPVEIHYRD